jgi:hypothetical protein
MFAVTHQIPKPVMDPSQKPALTEDVFEVTRPRDLELPVRQTVYDTWADKTFTTSTGHTFQDIIKIHDAEFNPFGVPFKTGLTRALQTEAGVPEQASSPPVELPAENGAPTSRDELIADMQAQEVVSSCPDVTLLVTKGGELWVFGVNDCILSADEALFVLRGTFKKNEECMELSRKEPDGAWVQHAMTAESLVKTTFKVPLKTGSWPVTPQPLGDLMLFLEKHGHVKVDIKLHSCKRNPEEPEKMIITAVEPSLLTVTVLEGHARKQAICKVACVLNCRRRQRVHACEAGELHIDSQAQGLQAPACDSRLAV